jgi:DNA-binding transcriptional regulator LsrR (DeoR family)
MKNTIGGKKEKEYVTGIQGRKLKQLLDDLKEKGIIEIERGSTNSQCVKKWLWKKL